MKFIRLSIIVVGLALLPACSSLWMGPGYEQSRRGTSSSLVDFLYPDGEIPPAVSETMPHLQLPVRVGIAFVPAQGQETISAAEKQKLMEHAADAFRDRDYVQSIETIPDTYMRSARGIKGMQQVAALYGVDIMALVSYDQMAFSGERDSAIMYWTVVGALFVKGNQNEVQTMIDTAVFDVDTAKLLFRSPGVYKDQRNVTLLESDRDLRKLREEGFTAATDDMIVNLDAELDVFRAEIDKGQRAQVAWREGYGGGAIGGTMIGLLLLSLVRRRRASREA